MYDYSRKTAAIDPSLAPLSRNWNRLKGVYETFLSNKLRENWQAFGLKVDGKSATVIFSPVTPNNRSILMEIYPTDNAQYRVRVSTRTNTRLDATSTILIPSVESFKQPSEVISRMILEDLTSAHNPNAEVERLILGYATKLPVTLLKAQNLAEKISSLVQAGAFAEAGLAMRELDALNLNFTIKNLANLFSDLKRG